MPKLCCLYARVNRDGRGLRGFCERSLEQPVGRASPVHSGFGLTALKSDGATTIAACRNADAVLPCYSELFDFGVIGALGSLLKIIANHSVGTDHVDLAAARAAGIVVTNTPDVLSDAPAEIAILCVAGAARRGAEGNALV
jgi:lactate dehydrogenase-like 2-hydroxyacid dehydrogenase